MRLLTEAELKLVAGGNNSSSDQNITLCGCSGGGGGYYGGGGYGGGGHGGGGGTYGPDIPVKEDDCPGDVAEAKDAVKELNDNSLIAKNLIDRVKANGVNIDTIKANTSGFGERNRFDGSTITWDPYLVTQGKNTDGSDYIITPIMQLAHELVHAAYKDDPAYQGVGSEARVMAIANAIAAEMNASTGRGYDTSRNNHAALQQWHSNDSKSSEYSLSRPGCVG